MFSKNGIHLIVGHARQFHGDNSRVEETSSSLAELAGNRKSRMRACPTGGASGDKIHGHLQKNIWTAHDISSDGLLRDPP